MIEVKSGNGYVWFHLPSRRRSVHNEMQRESNLLNFRQGERCLLWFTRFRMQCRSLLLKASNLSIFSCLGFLASVSPPFLIFFSLLSSSSLLESLGFCSVFISAVFSTWKVIYQKRNPISPNIKMFHKTDSNNINLITLASGQTFIFFSAS